MRGLIGFDDAVSLCRWQVAERYWLYGDEVRADPEAGWKRTMDKPLADDNLFLSFARLGGRGQNLPDTMILRWVHKHGLLRFKDTQADRLSFENQAPVAVHDFREEARRTHEALTLFTAIHTKNW